MRPKELKYRNLGILYYSANFPLLSPESRVFFVVSHYFPQQVGHTFLLGTKYSQVLNAFFSSDDGSRTLCQMGCYGLGISRIVAAAVEVMSNENEIRWPNAIAPFSVCVIAPKVFFVSHFLIVKHCI